MKHKYVYAVFFNTIEVRKSYSLKDAITVFDTRIAADKYCKKNKYTHNVRLENV